jgi:uncharacterized protein YcbX
MAGCIQSLYRYPVKGFSPEPLETASLVAGGYFPCDRIFAVENGPSSFKPWAPSFVPKTAFTVLARIPKVARARTRYSEVSGALAVTADDYPPFAGDLNTQRGRDAFALWLTGFLDPESLRGPLKVICAPPHRFTDHPEGFVSVLNLESVRDLEAKLEREIDPLRFRANVHVEGWPAWSELDWPSGSSVVLGGVRATVFKPIVRCAAVEVDPRTGERDVDLVKSLFSLYGHLYCGVYLSVAEGGDMKTGDAAELIL